MNSGRNVRNPRFFFSIWNSQSTQSYWKRYSIWISETLSEETHIKGSSRYHVYIKFNFFDAPPPSSYTYIDTSSTPTPPDQTSTWTFQFPLSHQTSNILEKILNCLNLNYRPSREIDDVLITSRWLISSSQITLGPHYVASGRFLYYNVLTSPPPLFPKWGVKSANQSEHSFRLASRNFSCHPFSGWCCCQTTTTGFGFFERRKLFPQTPRYNNVCTVEWSRGITGTHMQGN